MRYLFQIVDGLFEVSSKKSNQMLLEISEPSVDVSTEKWNVGSFHRCIYERNSFFEMQGTFVDASMEGSDFFFLFLVITT